MKLYIKHKPSNRCKVNVQGALERLGLPYRMMGMGMVEIKVQFTPQQLQQLEVILAKMGLDLVDGRKAKLIEKIKNIIVETVDQAEEVPKVNFSHYLAGQLKCDYNYLANLFSESTGTTIEHYVNTRKIERVKDLLLYDKISIAGIASKMNFSNVDQLIEQFTEATGITPMVFRQIKYN